MIQKLKTYVILINNLQNIECWKLCWDYTNRKVFIKIQNQLSFFKMEKNVYENCIQVRFPISSSGCFFLSILASYVLW